MDRKAKGKDAEKAAETFLKKQGLRSLLRNASCRMGEIDLVMNEGETIVFIEVRQRSSGRFGGAAQSVDSIKQRKLIQTAQLLLQQHPEWSSRPCRFDVIAFESGSAREPPIWYKDAFRP